MADRERDRDTRHRCAKCKEPIRRGAPHLCASCNICGAIILGFAAKDHRCEQFDERDYERETSRRHRCADCKNLIVHGKLHICTSCGLCGALLGLTMVGDHHCEPVDEDEREIAAEVERIIQQRRARAEYAATAVKR
jgi:hypothetical protein